MSPSNDVAEMKMRARLTGEGIDPDDPEWQLVRRPADPCHRCRGTGCEPANCAPELAAVMIVLLAWGAAWFGVGWWLR